MDLISRDLERLKTISEAELRAEYRAKHLAKLNVVGLQVVDEAGQVTWRSSQGWYAPWHPADRALHQREPATPLDLLLDLGGRHGEEARPTDPGEHRGTDPAYWVPPRDCLRGNRVDDPGAEGADNKGEDVDAC